MDLGWKGTHKPSLGPMSWHLGGKRGLKNNTLVQENGSLSKLRLQIQIVPLCGVFLNVEN